MGFQIKKAYQEERTVYENDLHQSKQGRKTRNKTQNKNKFTYKDS